MPLKIEQLKAIYNPHNIHAVNGTIDSASVLQQDFLGAEKWPAGPAVITSGKYIPQIADGALIMFGEIEIIGNVRIEKGAGARRHTVIEGSEEKGAVIEEHALAMDEVLIQNGHIGKRSGIAHGSRLKGTLGDDSFANISVRIGKNAVLPAGSAALPLWDQPENVTLHEVDSGGALYVGGGTPYALNQGVLNTSTKEWKFELNDDGLVWRRPIMVDGPQDPRAKYVLTMIRRNINPFLRPKTGVSYDAIGAYGVDRWLDEAVDTPETHEVTRARWLHNYVPIRQKIKSEIHLKEDAARFGEFVWHSSQMQSEILLLNRLAKILATAGLPQEAEVLNRVVAAQAYILGAYSPPANELESLDRAYADAEKTLTAALEKAKSIPPHNSYIVKAFPRETLNSIFIGDGESYNLTNKIDYEYGSEDIVALVDALKHVPSRFAATTGAFADMEAVAEKRNGARTAEVTEVENWRRSVNLRNENMILAEGTNRVHKYYGLVPILPENLIAVESDFGGAVVVGENAIIENSSFRSEQLIAPGYVGGLVQNTTSHTAGNEQEPFYIHKNAVVLNAQVHGAEIGESSYITPGTVVTDQSAITGIVAPESLLVKRVKGGWTYHIGNIAESYYPDKIKDKPEFMAWWTDSPFVDLDPANVEAVQERVQVIHAAKKEEILQKFAEKITEYGEIYRLSPLLQADSLQLDNAILLLKETNNTELANSLVDLKEGIEYLLGARAKITAGQAAALTASLKPGALLSKAIAQLNEIAEAKETVSLNVWPQEQNKRKTYRDVLADTIEGIHPLHDTPRFQFNYGLSKNDFTSQQVIAEQLHEHIDFYPEQVRLIAQQLQRIPAHIGKIREQSKATSREHTSHQPAIGYHSAELVSSAKPDTIAQPRRP